MHTLDDHRLHRDLTQSTEVTEEEVSLRSVDHLPMTPIDPTDDEQYLAHTRNNRYSGSSATGSRSSTIPAENVEFYSLEAQDIKGTPFDFAQLKGKYVLIVNVATQCVGAHQLSELESLHQRFKTSGVVVLGFPSNQFFQERAKEPQEIVEKCERKWHVTFPIMEKIRVNGKKQHNVFKYLKDRKRGFLHMKRVKWNYEKFLVDREGKIVQRYSSFAKPAKIEEEIAELLNQEKKIQLDKSKIVFAENQRVIYI